MMAFIPPTHNLENCGQKLSINASNVHYNRNQSRPGLSSIRRPLFVQKLQDPSVHLIYYGWSSDAKRALIDGFVENLGRSEWWQINKLRGAPSNLRLAGSTVIIPGRDESRVLNVTTTLEPVHRIIQEAVADGKISADITGNTSK
jgi:hypothetical protein